MECRCEDASHTVTTAVALNQGDDVRWATDTDDEEHVHTGLTARAGRRAFAPSYREPYEGSASSSAAITAKIASIAGSRFVR